jgi:hypothetical protein
MRVRIDAVELAGLDQRSDDGPVFCAIHRGPRGARACA